MWWAWSMLAPAPAAEPIHELARQDLRAIRTARTAFVLGCAAPGVAMIGRLALVPLTESEFGPQTAAALGVTVLGASGMVAAPIWLDSRARRSRRLLVDQGLAVRRSAPSVLTAGLAAAAPVILFAGFTPGNDAPPEVVALSLGTYGLAMGIGALQIDHNRQARLGSGWLGLSPAPSGMVLAGSW